MRELRHRGEGAEHRAGNDLADVGHRLGVGVAFGGSGGCRRCFGRLGGQIVQRDHAAHTGASRSTRVRALRGRAHAQPFVEQALHIARDHAAVRPGGHGLGEVGSAGSGHRLGARRNFHTVAHSSSRLNRLSGGGGAFRLAGRGSGSFGIFASAGRKFGVAFTGVADDADIRQAGNIIALFEEAREQRTRDLGFLIKSGLIGFIREQHVANVHAVANVFLPGGNDAAFHGLTLPRHNDCSSHSFFPSYSLDLGYIDCNKL